MIDKVTDIFWENILSLFPVLAQDSWGRMALAIGALAFVSGLSWGGVKIWQRAGTFFKKEPKAKFFTLPQTGLGAETYAYSARNTVFLGRDDEFQKLAKFAHDERIFCWWLIHGSGGIGKSRLALEFALHLNTPNRKWDTGFIQLETLNTREFEEWNPQRPTFLVLDYIAKNIVSSSLKEVDNNETKVSLLINSLAQRAIDKKLRHPVRVLLLEREYKINIKDNDYLKQDWYRSIAENLTSEGSVPANFEFEKPLLIEPLSEENLCALASAIYLENKGDLPFPKSLFLSRFYKIDSEKKRTLFVVYLAAEMAREQEQNYDTRESILQRLIDREFDSRWHTIIKSEKGLEYIIDATIRNGYRPDAEFLAYQERKNWLKLGCATLTSEGFKFLPLEPDLLGEYLLISGHAGDIFIPYTARKEIVRRAFEEVEDDAALFFMRCMLDYPQNDIWLNLFLDIRPDGVELRKKWLSYVIAMLWYLGHKDYFDSAYKIMEHILQEDSSLVSRMAKAFAVASIMGLLTDREGHGAALKYYHYFDELGDESYIQYMKASAIRILIEHYANIYDFENASKYIDCLRGFEQSNEVQRVIAFSSTYLIHAKLKHSESTKYSKKDLLFVENIYRKMNTLHDSKDVLNQKMRAASNLIYFLKDSDPIKTCELLIDIMPNCIKFFHYSEFRELLATVLQNITSSEALSDELVDSLVKLYKSTASIKLENIKNRELLAGVAQNYVIRYCNNGSIDKAEEIINIFSELGSSSGVRYIHAETLRVLHIYYCKIKNIERASEIISSIRELGCEYEVQIRLAHVLSQAMAAFDDIVNFELINKWYYELLAIFQSVYDPSQFQEVLCNAFALANMVLSTNHAKNGEIFLSKKYYEKMKKLPSISTIRRCIAHTVKIICNEFIERDAYEDIVSLYNDCASFGEEDDILATRIFLCMGMAAKCEKEGNPGGVYQFFDEAHSLTQNKPELLKINAFSAAVIIFRYMSDGDYAKAKSIFKKYKSIDCDKKARELFTQLERELKRVEKNK